MKQLLNIMLCSLALAMPVEGVAHSMTIESEISQVTKSAVSIMVKGHQIRVQHAQGLLMEIYSVTGSKVFSQKIDSNDQTLQLGLTRGCYIIKVGDVARKISIL